MLKSVEKSKLQTPYCWWLLPIWIWEGVLLCAILRNWSALWLSSMFLGFLLYCCALEVIIGSCSPMSILFFRRLGKEMDGFVRPWQQFMLTFVNPFVNMSITIQLLSYLVVPIGVLHYLFWYLVIAIFLLICRIQRKRRKRRKSK